MRTLLLVVAAIVLPLLVLLPLLAGQRENVRREGRAWRVAANSGSVLSLLMSAGLFIAGTFLLVRAVTSPQPWASTAVAVLLLTEGARTSFLFFPSQSRAAKYFVISHFVRAGGYCTVTLLLVVASFLESWWNLLFAGLALWFAAMSTFFARNYWRSRETPTENE